jgi:hypothetical protein
MVDQAGGMLLGEGGALQQMMGPGLGAGQEMFGRAVTGGQDFANQMNQYQQQLMGAVPGGGGGMMQPAVMPGGGGGMMGHQMMPGGGGGLAGSPEQRATEGAFGVAGDLRNQGPGFGFDFNNPTVAQGTQGVMDVASGLMGAPTGVNLDFSNPAIGAGMETIAGATGGLAGATPGAGIVSQAAQGSMASPQAYDFEAGRTTQAQTMETFNQAAQAARQTGLENVGQAFTGSQDALSAALASQGISPTSGVAAQALGDVAMQGAGQRAQLERDIAGAAGQTALQGAQFDVGTQLQREGMESGFGLGLQGLGLQGLGQAGNLGLGMGAQDISRLSAMGQLGATQSGLGQEFALGTQGLLSNTALAAQAQQAQNMLGAGNLMLGGTGLSQDLLLGSQGMMSNYDLARAAQQGQNLGAAGNLMLGAGGLSQQGNLARSAQQSQNIVNAANLARSGYMDPLSMQQDIYGQNILNPFMAGAGGLQNLLSTGLAGMGSSLDRSERQVGAAGQGKGAAMGSAFDPARAQAMSGSGQKGG